MWYEDGDTLVYLVPRDNARKAEPTYRIHSSDLMFASFGNNVVRVGGGTTPITPITPKESFLTVPAASDPDATEDSVGSEESSEDSSRRTSDETTEIQDDEFPGVEYKLYLPPDDESARPISPVIKKVSKRSPRGTSRDDASETLQRIVDVNNLVLFLQRQPLVASWGR